MARASDINRAEGVAEGATVGAGGALGATAGLAASAACGFMFVVCAPVFMVVGGAAGAGGAGLAVMASRGPEADLGPDPLRTLANRIAAFGRENDVDEQLRAAVVQKAGSHWSLVPASRRNSMTVQVIGFALRADSAERISLEVRAAVRLQGEDIYQPPAVPGGGGRPSGSATPTSGPAVVSASFAYEGAAADVGQWMDEPSDLLRTEVTRAYESIARQIIAALAPRN